jgi:hypothetical protein
MTRSISELVGRQVRKWEFERQGPEVQERAMREQRPVVVVSREYGAAGESLGAMVANELGFDLFDNELVTRIAQSAQVREQVVATVDGRRQALINEHLAGLFSGSTFTESDFLRHLCRVFFVIGRHGRAVVVGRGARFVFDPKRTLRVRAIAPLEARTIRVAERESLTLDLARRRILRKDGERIAFCHEHFHRQAGDVLANDLLVNTAYIKPEHAADLVATAFKQRFGTVTLR